MNKCCWLLLFLSLFLAVFNGLIAKSSIAGAALSGSVTICGQLETSGIGFDLTVPSENQTYYVDSNANHEQNCEMHQKVGNFVCLSGVLINRENHSVATNENTKLALASSYSVRDYTARNCEIFIDKAANIYTEQFGKLGPHGEPILNVFIKIIPERLDGNVRSVRFYGKHLTTGLFDSIIAKRWLNARDYYQVQLWDQMKGSFYVETVNGSRYWIHNDSDGNFDLNNDLIVELDRSVGFFGDKYPEHGPSFTLEKLPITAFAFPTLNPQRCR